MATLEEVARHVGVSITTVSRVLNGSEKVRADTRARVEQAVRKMGYNPSRVARRLRLGKGRTHLFGLVIPDIQNPFFSRIVRGCEDVAYEYDYAVILCNSDEDSGKEKFYLDALRSESVDGIIVPPVHEHSEIVADLVDGGVPVVCVDRKIAFPPVDSVIVDNRQGARDAVNHLVSLGHRRIALISGSPQYSSMRERQEGYESTLRKRGLSLSDELIGIGDLRQSSGRILADAMLDLTTHPTAFFVANNLMTLGAMEAIYARGLRIPEDIAIVGFDDMPWATLINPPLTVVKQPAYEMGKRAAEMLFQRIADPGREPAQVTLRSSLVIRLSCGSALGGVNARPA